MLSSAQSKCKFKLLNLLLLLQALFDPCRHSELVLSNLSPRLKVKVKVNFWAEAMFDRFINKSPLCT